MNFYKSVFADETTPPDSPKSPTASTSPHPQEDPSDSAPWSFGGFLKNLATKSESVIDTYRHDLQELGSGLKEETAVIRDVASRSFEAGASVAQDSLESVGQAIDDIGSTVWKSTAHIISHGTDSILAPHLRDHDRIDSVSSSSSSNQRNLNLDVKRYSRFEMQVRAIQFDLNTYCSVPEDEDYDKWRSESFMLEERGEEIERLRSENADIREIYNEVVPSRVDNEGFWSRYFYRVHKLKQAEEARALLVKRVISAEEEEALSWDFDDDDDEGIDKQKAETSRNVEPGNSVATEEKIENLSERVCSGDKNSDGKKVVAAAAVAEGKGDNGESCKDSDVSVVSSQSVPEEEDLGWDQIEDVGSDDELKREVAGSSRSASRVDIHKRLSSAEEEEELSWGIEDEDDDSAKP